MTAITRANGTVIPKTRRNVAPLDWLVSTVKFNLIGIPSLIVRVPLDEPNTTHKTSGGACQFIQPGGAP